MAETPNNEDKTFDVGQNVENLGMAFLFFRYVWPTLIAIGAIIACLIALHWLLAIVVQNPIQFQKFDQVPPAPHVPAYYPQR